MQEEGWGLSGGQETLEPGGGGSGDRDTQMLWLGSDLSPGTQFCRCLKAGTPLPQTTYQYFKIRQEQSLLYLKHVLLCLTFPSLCLILFFSLHPGFLIFPFRAEFSSFPFHAIEVNSVYFRSCSLMYQGILLCITSIS